MSTQTNTLTYTDAVIEHHRLNINYEQTIKIIDALFPGNRADATGLWQQLETQRAYSKETFSQ